MARTKFTLFAMTFGVILHAQSGFILHMDSIQAGRSGDGVSIREVSDGYLVFCRQHAQTDPGQHFFVRKLSQTGVFQHEFEYSGSDTLSTYSGQVDPVASLPDGNFAATISEGFGTVANESWFYKFDPQGDTILRKLILRYPVEDSVYYSIRQTRTTQDGGYVLVGSLSRSGISAGLVVRLNSDADTLWTKKILISTGGAFSAVEEYSDGGFLLAGSRNMPLDASAIVRVNSVGQVQWLRYFGGRGLPDPSVKITPEGDIVSWSTYSEIGWPSDTYKKVLTKWSPSGDIIWQTKTDSAYFSATWDLEQLADGGFIGSGYRIGEAQLSKFNSAGDSVWSRTYTILHGSHHLFDVEQTTDGGFAATGIAYRYQPLDPDIQQGQTIFVIKTDSLGCVVPGCHTVGVEEYALDLNEYLTVFPNPVAQGCSLSISFNPSPEYKPKEPLRVVVLDAMGKRVLDQPFTHHYSPFTNLQSGIYYLHLTDGTTWLAGSAFVVE